MTDRFRLGPGWSVAVLLFIGFNGSMPLALAKGKPLAKQRSKTGASCPGLLSAHIPADWVQNQIKVINRDGPQTTQLREAVKHVGFNNVALNSEILRNHDTNYTLTLPRGKISDQMGSGRCWIFAGTNMLRSIMLRSGLIDTEFQFSHNYLWFFHFLEQTNRYVRKLISSRSREFSPEKLRQHLQFEPEQGGYFEYFSYLVNKYGLVPLQQMPDTAQSAQPNALIEELMREGVLIGQEIERQIGSRNKPSSEKLRRDKDEMMSRIFRILATHLGVPPTEFKFRARKLEDPDIENGIGQIKTDPAELVKFTPLQFAKGLIGFNPDDWVTITADPLKATNQLYRVKNSMMSVAGEEEFDFNRHALNVTPRQMEKAVLASLQKAIPVWTAVDIARDVDHETGIMHPDLFNRSAVYGPKFDRKDDDLSRKEGVYSRFYSPKHAVLLYGADWPAGAEYPIKYRIENSWGYWAGDFGEYHMYREWFLKYNYEVVIYKKTLSAELARLLEGKALNIHAKWDW